MQFIVSSIRSVLLVSAVLTGLSFAAHAQEEGTVDPTAVEAKKLLRQEVGIWECRWELLDQEGKVFRVVEGSERIDFGPSQRVLVVITEVPEVGRKSISLKFYHPVERKIHFVSVGQDGDMWLLTEEVGSGVLVSEPHKNPDGSFVTIRFTVLEKSEDSIKVLMERTTDGEKTWTPVFYQYLTRRKSG